MTTFRVGAATDVGRVRSNNQDSNLVATNLYAVADGMGGHQGGEVASAIAVDTLRAAVTEPTATSLIEGVKLANTAIHSRQAEVPQLRGMGTTLCAVALVETPEDTEEILVVNVGDSRVYRFHEGALAQITDDHSLVEDLRREGRLTAEEAAVHPHRNVLTRALGIDANVVVDDFRLPPHDGDRYLLCSDGLFNEVSEDRIAATLRRLADPADAASELVRQANENGGRDNITCLVVDVADVAATAVAAPTAPRTREEPLRAATTGEAPVSAPPPMPDAGGDLAGFTQPVPEASEALAADAAGSDGPSPVAGAADAGESDGRANDDGGEPAIAVRRRRRFTWRVLVFAVAFLVVVAAAVVVIAWQGRGTYYVAFDHDQLVVYQGTPGGLLGIDPTLYRRCPGLTSTNIPTTLVVQIRDKKTFSSFPDGRKDALAYVGRVAQQAHSSCGGVGRSTTGPSVTLPPGTSTSTSTATTVPAGALNPGAGAGNAGATTTVGLAPLSPVTLTHPRPASGLP